MSTGPSLAVAALRATPARLLEELEWFGWFFDQGFMSLDEEMRQMETFAKHIIPAFR